MEEKERGQGNTPAIDMWPLRFFCRTAQRSARGIDAVGGFPESIGASSVHRLNPRQSTQTLRRSQRAISQRCFDPPEAMSLRATLTTTPSVASVITKAPRRSSRPGQAERLVVMVRGRTSVLVVGCCLASPPANLTGASMPKKCTIPIARWLEPRPTTHAGC